LNNLDNVLDILFQHRKCLSGKYALAVDLVIIICVPQCLVFKFCLQQFGARCYWRKQCT